MSKSVRRAANTAFAAFTLFAAGASSANADVTYSFFESGGTTPTISFTESSFLTTAGTIAITPFTDGATFTQAALGLISNGNFAFGFADASQTLTGTSGAADFDISSTCPAPLGAAIESCGPGATLASVFQGPLPTAPGTFTAVVEGADFPQPPFGQTIDTLKITESAVPEPNSILLVFTALVTVGLVGKKRLRRA